MSAIAADGATGIKILVCDQEPLVREALTRLVAELGEPAQVLESESLEAARGLAGAHPDLALVILDLALPDANGVDAIQRLQQANAAPILVLSAKDDPATARASLDAGARGFISKRSPTRVLLEALRLVLVGGMYVPPQALQAAVDAASTPRADAEGPATPRSLHQLGLTPRQRDVLTLLMQGKPNKSICRELALAEGTVKTHTAAIYRALGVTNRTQAVYAMSRLGVELPLAPLAPEAAAAPREPRAPVRETTRARAAAESLRTVTSRLQAAAEGGGRWAAMLGFQPA
jgi:DNA-binding NarL/FixJ family response regulator